MSQADSANITNLPTQFTEGRRRAIREAALARHRAIARKQAIRKEAAAEIERLLALLDRLDGDPDLEPSEDSEPTLGWSAGGAPVRAFDSADGEVEPSLGWTAIIDQTSRNRLGDVEDREKDEADREPSLAAPETGKGSQRMWARGNIAELEGDATEDDGDVQPRRSSDPWENPAAGWSCNETGKHIVITGPDGKAWRVIAEP